ncbi:hypothetical protein D3C73_1175900 [compost metagenome]
MTWEHASRWNNGSLRETHDVWKSGIVRNAILVVIGSDYRKSIHIRLTGVWQPITVCVADDVQFHILANQSTASIYVSSENHDIIQRTVQCIVNKRLIQTVVEIELSCWRVRHDSSCSEVDHPLRLAVHVIDCESRFTDN